MVRDIPKLNPTRNYNIKEVCAILNIHRDTLRKYTNLEMIVPVIVSCREIYYKGSEILNLWNSLNSQQHD